MINWVKDRILSGAQKLLNLAHAAIDAVLAVWHVFTGFLHIMRIVFADLGAAISGGLHLLLNFVEWTAKTLWHVAVIAVPNAARWAVNRTIAWATTVIGTLRAYLLATITTVRDFIMRNLNHLIGNVAQIRDYLLGLISQAVTWVARIGNRVADIVLHPDKLAAWLLPALWGPLWRYLQSQGVAIGRWLLARSAAAVVASAGMIESMLAKIL